MNALRNTILYIDDEEMNLMLFERIFKKQFNIITVLSAEEGLVKLAAEEQIDIIITDLSMPGMDGIEFIKQAHKKHPSKRYFILTGHDDHPEIETLLREGVLTAQLNKPFQPHHIIHSLGEEAFQH